MSLIAPQNIDEIDANWLTAALQARQFLATDNFVVAFERQIIGLGVGLCSRVARYQLQYHRPPEKSPHSVVVKIEPED